MIYCLAYPEFNSPTQQAIAQFRAEHERERARLVAAHVTLVFALTNVKEEDFISFCRERIEATPRFSIRFAGAAAIGDPEEQVWKLVLPVVEGADALTDLHESLYDGPHRAELHDNHSFQPHMTVATNREQAAIVRAADAIGRIDLTERVEVRKVHVVRMSEERLFPLDRISLS